MAEHLRTLREIFALGGWVMYPLLALSLLSLALCFERAVFWIRTHNAPQRRRTAAVAARLRRAEVQAAGALAEQDRTVYGWFARELLAEGFGPGRTLGEAAVRELVEEARRPIERFSVFLSTIITAAPMLGILGTVTGIIESFGLLGGKDALADPSLVAGGIAEALYTTVFGLVVAIVTLFPYVVFRAQADRAFGRLETLAAAALEGASRPAPDRPEPAQPVRPRSPEP